MDILKVKRLSEHAILPKRNSYNSSGYDLCSAAAVKVPPRGQAVVPTDLAVALPEGITARIAPRSDLATKHQIDVCAGVVDYGHRGNLGVLMFNHAAEEFVVRRGDRIAQLILERLITPDVVEVLDLPIAPRVMDGFGSPNVLEPDPGSPLVSQAERLVWVDLEMTGLDIDSDVIMEMACIITDRDLQTIAEGPNLIIHVEDEQLAAMGEWCRRQHGYSGLTEACRRSRISLQQAEQVMLDFISQHVPSGKCPLAGNSIHCDKKFLDKYMPRFAHHLCHRIIDVSTIKELCRRWYPLHCTRAPSKSGAHRAMDDIRGSIAELAYYRRALFK